MKMDNTIITFGANQSGTENNTLKSKQEELENMYDQIPKFSKNHQKQNNLPTFKNYEHFSEMTIPESKIDQNTNQKKLFGKNGFIEKKNFSKKPVYMQENEIISNCQNEFSDLVDINNTNVNNYLKIEENTIDSNKIECEMTLNTENTNNTNNITSETLQQEIDFENETMFSSETIGKTLTETNDLENEFEDNVNSSKEIIMKKPLNVINEENTQYSEILNQTQLSKENQFFKKQIYENNLRNISHNQNGNKEFQKKKIENEGKVKVQKTDYINKQVNFIEIQSEKNKNLKTKNSPKLESSQKSNEIPINRSATYKKMSSYVSTNIENLIKRFLKQREEFEQCKAQKRMLERQVDDLNEEVKKKQQEKYIEKEKELKLAEAHYEKKIKFLQNLIQKANQEKKVYEQNIQNVEELLNEKKRQVNKLQKQKPLVKDLNDQIKKIIRRIDENQNTTQNKFKILKEINSKYQEQHNEITRLDQKLAYFKEKERDFLKLLEIKNQDYSSLRNKFEGAQIMLESQKSTIKGFRDIMSENNKMLRNYSVRYQLFFISL